MSEQSATTREPEPPVQAHPDDRDAAPPGMLRRWGPPGLVLVVGLLLSLFAARRVQEETEARCRAEFRVDAEERQAAVRAEIEQTLEATNLAHAFFAASHDVEPGEFVVFADAVLQSRPSVASLEWAPRVRRAERAAFEAAASVTLGRDFIIRDRTPEADPVVAPERDEYFPVLYVHPAERNAGLLGLDRAGEPARAAALLQAARTGRLAVSAPIRLYRAPGASVMGVAAFIPLYQSSTTPPTPEGRLESLKGVIVVTFAVDELVQRAIRNFPSTSVLMHVFDPDVPPHGVWLYDHGPEGDPPGIPRRESPQAHAADYPEGLSLRRPIDFGGRTWEVLATPRIGQFGCGVTQWEPIAVLGGGILLSLLGAFLLSGLDTRARTAALLEHRRVQLERANRTLSVEMGERRSSARALEASESRFRTIAETINQLFWLMDLDPLRVVYLSPAFERIWGRPADLVYRDPKSWLEWVHPEDRDLVAREFDRFIARPEAGPYAVEYRLIRPDSGVRWVRVRGSLVPGPHPGPRRVTGYAEDITESRRAEIRRREADEIFREQFHTNQAIKLVIDPVSGEIVEANEAACRFYGYPHPEMLTRRIFDVNTQTPEQTMRAMARAAEREQMRFEFRHRTGGGQVRDVEVYTGPFITSGRTLLFAIIHDVTDRKKTETALQASEATNRALLHAIPDLMFRMDREGRYIDYHAPDEAQLMLPPGEFLGRTVSEVLPEGRANQCMENLNRLFATGLPQTYEYQIGPEGSGRTWEVRMVQARADEALLLVRNITDRRLAEKRLRNSEARLSLLVHSTPLGVIFWDMQFKVREWNPGAERIFGYTAAQALDQHASFIVPPAARAYVDDVWRGLVSGTGGQRGTNQNIRSDGSIIFCEWYNSPLVGPDGKVMAVASVVEDVTDRRLNQQRQDLMVAELDHRVKNNLAAVISLAEQTGRTAEGYNEFLEKFMGRLRAMSRMHSALANSRWKGADLRTLVQQTLEAFGSLGRTEADGPGINLSPRAAQAMAMALNELATNAVKYGALSVPDGAVRVAWQTTSAAGQPDSLELTWTEIGGPPVTPPTRKGFGTDLIEGAIAYELHGQVKIDYRTEGVVCSIQLQLDNTDAAPPGEHDAHGI